MGDKVAKSDKTAAATRVDVTALAKAAAKIDGQIVGSDMPRFLESVTSLSAPVSWTARGSLKESSGREPETRIHLQVRAQVVLTCQRCLEPMAEALSVDRTLRFVADAELAEQLDEASDDEDVLELPRRLNLVALIEDELIMTLPIVPRHEQCPRPPAMVYEQAGLGPAAEESDRPHPFAALTVLRDMKS